MKKKNKIIITIISIIVIISLVIFGISKYLSSNKLTVFEKKWIDDNEKKVNNYIILDDEDDMFGLEDHLVLCNDASPGCPTGSPLLWHAPSAGVRHTLPFLVRSTRAITAQSSCVSSGLETKPSIPASIARLRSSSKALAVIAMIGMRESAGSFSCRMRRVASQPPITGIWISISTRA